MQPIVLVNPPFVPCVSQSMPVEDIGAGYLVALLEREGYSVRLIEANMERLDIDQVVTQVRQLKYSAIILPLMYRTLANSLNIARKIRCFTERPILGCSNAATLSWRQILDTEPSFDAIILGEVETTLLDLASKWAAGADWRVSPGLVVRNGTDLDLAPSRALIQNLDDLPFPARGYLGQSLQNRPVIDILSSRGCHGHCAFCNVRALYAYNPGPAWRGRSAANVVDEIEQLCRQRRAHHFEFVDECFIGPGELGEQRAWDIASEILARKLSIDFRIFCRVDQVNARLFSHLKKAGLCTVNVGIENGNDRVLQRLRKGITVKKAEQAIEILRDLDLSLFPSLIMFEPTMTVDELRENLRFVARHRLWNCIAPTAVIPFAGTSITQTLKKESLLALDEFILPPYIHQVRFRSPVVADLFQKWSQWENACDAKHDRLLYKLSSAYCILLERSFDVSEQGIWQSLGELFKEQKRLEVAYIDREIKSLTEFEPDICSCTDLDEQLGRSRQEMEQILTRCPAARWRLSSAA